MRERKFAKIEKVFTINSRGVGATWWVLYRKTLFGWKTVERFAEAANAIAYLREFQTDITTMRTRKHENGYI